MTSYIEMQKEFRELLREYIALNDTSKTKKCAISAIVFNRPDILHEILHVLFSSNPKGAIYFSDKYSPDKKENEYKFHTKNCDDRVTLTQICELLQRTECARVLASSSPEDATGTISNPLIKLRVLNLLHYDFEEFNSEIETAIKASPSIKEAVNSIYARNRTRLHLYGKFPKEVKMLLEMNGNVDAVDDRGKTPVTALLSRADSGTNINAYTSLCLMLEENPSIHININAVIFAIGIDCYMEMSFASEVYCGKYLTDAKKHSVLGTSCIDDAMHFFSPLLIECGFRVSRDTLVDALDKTLHKTVIKYIREYLRSPRKLQLLCRDTLRGHFKRRRIHVFVDSVAMPKSMKDFILLHSYF